MQQAVNLDELFGGAQMPPQSYAIPPSALPPGFATAPPAPHAAYDDPPPPPYDLYPAPSAVQPAYYPTAVLPPAPHHQQQQSVAAGGSYGYATSAPQPSTAPGVSYAQQHSMHSFSVASGGTPLPPQQQQQQQQQPMRSQEEEDKAQLEKIIRLRRELEMEQQREQQKREELQTWPCVECTFRNPLSTTGCEMCGAVRPGCAPPPKPQHMPSTPVPAPAPAPASVAGVTAWQCGICLAPNEARHTRCKVCSAYQQNGTPMSPAATNTSSSPAQGRQQSHIGQPPMTTDWQCSICGKINSASQSNCPVCNSYQRNGIPVTGGATAPRQDSITASAEPPAPAKWMCSVCTLENNVSSALCVACSSGQRPRHMAPPRPAQHATHRRPSRPSPPSAATAPASAKGEWPCRTCTFINKLRRSKCDMCGAARPSKYAPVISAHERENRKKQEDESDEDEVQWQDDRVANACNRCHQEFGIMRRKHHCRACGYVFCANCSQYYIEIKRGRKAERVCSSCFSAREQEQQKDQRKSGQASK